MYKKLLNMLYTVLFFFFTSSGGVDDVTLIKQIIKDVTLMCIAFKHPQIFWES